MTQRVRARLVIVAVALSLVAGLACGVFAPQLAELDTAGGVFTLVIASLATGVIVANVGFALTRRELRDLADAMQHVVRDPTRRVPIGDAPPGDEVRAIAEWMNSLAEDATRSHQALARERVLLTAVAEGSNQGVIAVDAKNCIELVNDAARKMLGESSTPVGMPLIELMRVPQAFELIESADANQAEVELPNGPRTLIRVGRKWESDEGRVLLLEDVTTMRRLETVRRDFVANVSHELRTPVAVIRANAETLLAGAKDDPVMGIKLIDAVHRNAERLARVLTDLLDLSRLDAGQYRMHVVPTEIKAIAEQALTVIETPAAARKVAVHVELPDGLRVKADPKVLDQIFVNLIENAVKYTRPEGNVWVAARLDGDRVRIEIRDDGPGIAAKHRERVFERFYRTDASRAREAGGTGLGLSIVKHLVETMGGSVGVEPNTPTGSIFWVRLRSAP